MKNLLLNTVIITSIFLFSIQIIYAQNFQFQGNITNDTTWSADTLEITGDVLIDSNVTLTVLPGTFVHITGYFSIQSYGAIRAIGTETDTIVFTHLDTSQHADTSTIAGGWHGIRLLPRISNDTSVFIYCRITNGKSVVPGSWWSIENHENNGGNIYCYDFGSLIIKHSFISNGVVKRDGAGIYCKNGEYVSIKNNHFFLNHGYNQGGGIYAYAIDSLVISDNLINYNTAYHLLQDWEGGEGGGILAANALGYSSFTLICNNKVFNNKGVCGGISDAYFNSNISNNLICNNYGQGLWNAHSFNSPTYTNNTIANNWGNFVSGVMVISYDVRLVNNIIWNNLSTYPGNPQIFFLGNENPEVMYCDVMNGYQGEGNIDEIPNFVMPTQGVGLDYNALNADWSLTNNSPCVNTGTPDTSGLFLPDYDIEGNPRICGFRIDMGAYENQVFAITEPVLQENIFTSVYPNPGTNQLYIRTKLKNSTFELIDFTGKIIIHKTLNSFTKQINTSNIPSGMYFYRIHNNEKIVESGKWVKGE